MAYTVLTRKCKLKRDNYTERINAWEYKCICIKLYANSGTVLVIDFKDYNIYTLQKLINNSGAKHKEKS
jgi:predicted CDP-diglyceride synthetase/phosphatidate cytidylyltransferase